MISGKFNAKSFSKSKVIIESNGHWFSRKIHYRFKCFFANFVFPSWRFSLTLHTSCSTSRVDSPSTLSVLFSILIWCEWRKMYSWHWHKLLFIPPRSISLSSFFIPRRRTQKRERKCIYLASEAEISPSLQCNAYNANAMKMLYSTWVGKRERTMTMMMTIGKIIGRKIPEL